MKLSRYLLFIFLLAFCLQGAFGQTATFAGLTGGLATTVTAGNTQVAVAGFSVQVAGGSITFSKFTFTCSPTTSDAFLGNGTLYRYTTDTYGTGTGVAVGNVTFSGANITIDNLTETISGTNYYFLVADAVNSTAGYFQIVVNYAGTFATDNVGTNYPANFSYNQGLNYNAGTPYALAVSNQSTLASTAAIITPGTTAVKLFAFSVTNKSASSKTLTGFNINSNLASVSALFGTFKIYTSTTTTFPGSAATATASSTGSYITYTGMSQAIAAGATRYFWIVANCLSGASIPTNAQFNFSNGQSSAAISAGSTTYNDFTVSGKTYNINTASVTVTSQTGGVSAGTITANQTGIVLFGFGISATSGITVSGFNINSSSSSLSSYFGNGRLVVCTTASYAAANSTQIGTVVFNGSYANVTLTTNQTITTTAKYYFLLADNTGPAPNTTTAVNFNFISGQSQSAVTQTSPAASSYNTFTITGNSFTLPGPYFTVTGANSTTTNGITSGSLVYGQKDVVLYGFAVTATGSPFTLNTFNVKTSGAENSYFTNARLYRSTSSVFPGGTPLYTSAATGISPGIFVSGGGYFNCNVTETIPAGTTYYYWLVADYSVFFGAPGTFTCSFASGQGSPAFITASPYATYNTYNVTGNAFNVISSEFWTGGTSGDLTNALNFTALNGGTGVAASANTVIIIGGHSYINPPSITAAGTTTVAGISFGTAVANPRLTIAAGSTLKITSRLTDTSSNATISGGTVSLTNTAISTMDPSSVLTLSGTTLNNAGSFTMAPAAQLNFSGTTNVANTGTFTLQSDSTGSASIGAHTAGTITGTFAVERYLPGGVGHRGYYLMSSPVADTTVNANKVYKLQFLLNSMYLTGGSGVASGFSKGGNPSLYLYREDQVPSNTSFTSGNFWGVTNMANAFGADYNMNNDNSAIYNIPVGNGFMVFFRGNKAAGTLAQETLTTFITAPTVTMTHTGTLNTGQIAVHNWYTPASANLGWTNAVANSSVRGFNLVGNPYPSSIDWETYQTTSTTTGIYANNVGNTIYEYNPITHNYDTYQQGGASTGDATSTIVSGQGFFVQAANGTAPQLIFNETAKVATQNIGSQLFMSTRASIATAKNAATESHLRLRLVKDAVNFNETYIGFTSKGNAKHVFNEDAPYNPGLGLVSLASLSSDSVALSINKYPLPTTKSDTIYLKVNATYTGTYTLNLSDVSSLSNRYEVWLKDAYTKDSLNMRQNATYSFNLNLADAATYGSKRFSLIVRENMDRRVQLLDFTAQKAVTGVEVDWKTANENSYTIFTVERSTDKGITFSSIGGFTSNNQASYSLVDKNPVIGQNQYRLKIENVTGKITYSKVVSVTYSNAVTGANSNISVYPNPVVNKMTLVITPAISTSSIKELTELLFARFTGDVVNSDSYTITIVSNSGAVVKKAETNQIIWQADLSNLMPGSYVIQVVSKNGKGLIGQCVFIKL